MPPASSVERPVILIADDEASLRLLVRETLEDDARIIEAADGPAALEIARRDRPYLILLDVAMPGLSGLEVCQQLKADPVTAGITVIILTAHGQTKDREQAFACGADHFIAKPFSPLQLLKLVNQIL